MYIEKTIKIYFDLDEIKKNICERGCKVKEAIHDYAEELKKDGFED